MFESFIFFAAPILAGMAVAMMLVVPFLMRQPAEGDLAGTGWRDRAPAVMGMFLPVARIYAGHADKLLTHRVRRNLDRQLGSAGVGFAITPAEFRATQWLMTVLTLAVGWFLASLLGLTLRSAVITLLCAAVAYGYPLLWLRETAKNRQARIQKEFPFFLDVLVLSMRAGLAFNSALQTACAAMPHGPVREEFVRVLRQARAGVRRRDALDRLDQRVHFNAISNFVAAVNQAEETGAALSEILSDQAQQRRQERFMRAEKLANQAPVKLLFPLVALLFPITFVIIMWPIAMEFLQAGVL